MSVDQVVAAALDLSREDRISLLEQVEDSLAYAEVDPADIEDSRRIMREIQAGRMKATPAEDVLDMLDRMSL